VGQFGLLGKSPTAAIGGVHINLVLHLGEGLTSFGLGSRPSGGQNLLGEPGGGTPYIFFKGFGARKKAPFPYCEERFCVHSPSRGIKILLPLHKREFGGGETPPLVRAIGFPPT